MKPLEQCSNEELLALKKSLENDAAKYGNAEKSRKVQLNSAYGAFGSNYFRLYDLRIAEAITMHGQVVIRGAANAVDDFLNSILKTDKTYVVGSDTDSVMIHLGDLVKQVFPDPNTDKTKIVNFLDLFCKDHLQKVFNQYFEDTANYTNAYKQAMRIGREVIADRAVYLAKKKYVMNVLDQEGVRYTEPKQKIMGLETARSSTPEVCRNALKASIKLIMNSTEAETNAFIQKFKAEFCTLPAVSIAFPRGCNGMHKYSSPTTVYQKGTPIHVRGALVYNHLIKTKGLSSQIEPIRESDKIKFIYLKLPNPIKENIIAFTNDLPKQLGLDAYVDYELQFEKTFLDPLKNIMETIGWKTSDQTSLEDFFG